MKKEFEPRKQYCSQCREKIEDCVCLKEPSADVAPSTQKGAQAPNVAEPTPTPWRYKIDARGIYIFSETDPDSAGGEIAEIFRFHDEPLALANAQFILTAVNSHKELLAACKGVLLEFDEWAGPREIESDMASVARNQCVDVYEACRAAVALAERKP